MKGNKTNIRLEWNKYDNNWRIHVLFFVFWLLGFKQGGGSSGANDGTESQYFNMKKFKWVEIEAQSDIPR